MKLILICRESPFTSQTGTEIYIRNLAIELANQGNTVQLIYGGKPPPSSKMANFAHSLGIINIPFVRSLDFRRKCADLCNKLTNELKVDAVIVSGAGTFAGYIFSRLKKPTCLLSYYAMDSMKMEYERSKLSAESKWTFTTLDRWVRYAFLIRSDKSSCFYSDLILASSRDTANHMATDYGVSSNKIEVFYEGVPDNFAEGIEIIDPDTPVFLHIGGGFRKGTCYFLEAMKLLKEKYALEARAIVTRGNSVHTKVAKSLGLDVEIHSHLPFSELKRLYAASTTLVSPSLSEGFCLPVIEAAMFKKPAIVTNVGSLPELVVDGKSGFVIPVADTATLADKMYQIAVDEQLRNQMGANAAKFSQRFKISNTAKTLVKLLTNKLQSR